MVPGEWLITQSKNSISALELSRQIGVKWETAWRLRQKLASVMAEVQARCSFKGRIEMDDAVLGGEKSEAEGGHHGRRQGDTPTLCPALLRRVPDPLQ